MKIIIADDEPVARAILQHTLEILGHEVVVTSDGIEAWETFDREPVRLIVSDWKMPRLDGLSFCQKVRDRKKTLYTYFILLTAQDTRAENYQLATKAAVDDFLTKPFDRHTIEMRLRVAERILRFTTEIRQLRQLIPICSYCQKIRNDADYWQLAETYIREQTDSDFTHGICHDCAGELMAELDQIPPVLTPLHS